MSGSLTRSHFLQGLVGLAGGLIGGLAMNAYARAVSSATGGRESDGAAPGADRVGRGLHIYSFVGHWLYGATVETVRRLALPGAERHR